MSNSEKTELLPAGQSGPAVPPPDAAPAVAQPAMATWTAHSVFDRHDERKMGRAFAGSIVGHGVLFGLIILLGWKAAQQVVEQDKEKIDVVYLQDPGPGGGGGGSPKPAPVQKMEVPKPQPTPTVVPTPVPVPTPIPDPTINAPVMTLSNVIQANGLSSVNLAAFGGGGSGGGIGKGKGDGVGEGTGGGFGGGAFRPGNGCTDPVPIRQPEPQYTSEAMRAKLQGIVTLEAVVSANGTITETRIVNSLDKVYGLDEEAVKSAKKWLFHPATCRGTAQPMIVTLEIEFRLH